MTAPDGAFDGALDVAVVGGGGAGLMAALRAARNRELVVAVFERSTKAGSNTQFSSGSLAAGGTRFQSAAGVVDSPEQHAADLLAVSGDVDSGDLVHAVCEAAPQYVHWFVDELGHPLELGVDMVRSGQSVPRLHTDPSRTGGTRLVQTLRSALARHDNVAFVDSTPVLDLVTDRATDGVERVTGVRVNEHGGPVDIAARHTVLASDGFGANANLVRRFCPDAADAFYGGSSTSQGDAIGWGEALGARLVNMTGYLGSGMVVAGHGTRLNPNLPWLGAVLVGADGRRFCDERGQGYSKLAVLLARQPGSRAAVIWDDPAMAVAANSELMRESIAARAFVRFESVAELATGLGLAADELTRTLDNFEPQSDLVSRPGSRLEGALYAAWVTPGMLTTQGGLDIDLGGRVLTDSGRAIEGLYAAGGAARGISGPSPEGYSSGNGLLAALGMGWRVGNHLAAAG